MVARFKRRPPSGAVIISMRPVKVLKLQAKADPLACTGLLRLAGGVDVVDFL